VTSKDARVLFASLFASDAERFDVVDVDSFGSEVFVDDALRVTKLGGYCYVTSTDALALCGKNPPRLMSQYGGARVAPNAPAVNETGLRVFVGDAVRRGAAQGLKVTPVFSLFHPHGPVFRAMLRVEKLKGAWGGDNVGFLAQCDACGETRGAEEAEARDGSPCFCRRCGGEGGQSMAVSGPMWTGPMHDAAAVQELAREAEEVAWSGAGEKDDDASAEDDDSDASPMKGQKASARELLAAFAAEADPALPPFYRRTDELARAGRGLEHGIPPLDEWVAELQRRGFAACRSHVDARGLKSDAPMDDVLAAGNAVANAAKNEP
jgi:tRNA (guanine26-N2/guanine27-N2)-dimethyltransferase